LKKRAAELLLRNGLIVSAVGDIGEADLARQIDRSFGLLPTGNPPALPPQWVPPTKPRVVVVERPVPQSSALMALPGIPRDDPDWYAALVMNHVLGGGGQQSRLFNEVREKRGLAYSVSSGLRTYKRAALLVMSTGSANERVADELTRSGRIYSPEELHDKGIVDLVADDGEGPAAVRDYLLRKAPMMQSIFQMRRRVARLTRAELDDIVDIWVDTALKINPRDLKLMGHLVARQNRLH